jgi:hypothetical protein
METALDTDEWKAQYLRKLEAARAGKRVYLLGHLGMLAFAKEMLEYSKCRGVVYLEMATEEFTLAKNKEWLARAAAEVRAGVARIELAGISFWAGSVFANEIDWLRELGFGYCHEEEAFVPLHLVRQPYGTALSRRVPGLAIPFARPGQR